MPSRRPDPSTLLERERAGRGRDAVYGAPHPATAPANGDNAATWEARHKRVTFHCPLELLDELATEVERSGRKKNAVIVDALRTHLRQR
jgi:hypothetical protein